MPLAKLQITNFESHQNTEIEFSKGLTVIIGEPGKGKSAIVRALKWLLYNNLPDTGFIRQGCKQSIVKVFLANGYIITREKGPQTNRYLLQHKDSDQKEYFEDVECKVPRELTALHGVKVVYFDPDLPVSLHLEDQHEGPFLMLQPDSVRLKAIAHICNGDLFDKAKDETANSLAALREQVKMLNRQLDFLTCLHHKERKITSLQKKRNEIVRHIDSLNHEIDLIVQTYSLLDQASYQALRRACEKVEALVTHALRYVFSTDLEFRIQIHEFGTKPKVQFAVLSNLGYFVTTYAPHDTRNRAIVDLISVMLRIALLEMGPSPLPGPLILDEPGRCISGKHASYFGRLLKILSDQFERQIILVTRDHRLTGSADAVYVIEKKDGRSLLHYRGNSPRVNCDQFSYT
ncbi:MAG: AAA family ATPase [Peptococcaceae bacterium]|nr:AAA family ATPase [Peptococcaceae bacterium]